MINLREGGIVKRIWMESYFIIFMKLYNREDNAKKKIELNRSISLNIKYMQLKVQKCALCTVMSDS
jgi:hypothetical protein